MTRTSEYCMMIFFLLPPVRHQDLAPGHALAPGHVHLPGDGGHGLVPGPPEGGDALGQKLHLALREEKGTCS